MIGNTVAFESPTGGRVKGIVYSYEPKGNYELNHPYIKVRALYPYVIEGDVRKYSIYTISLDDPSLEILSIDREIGTKLENDYVGKTEDSESNS